MSTLTPLGTHYPFTFGLQILHSMHTNTKRVLTTFAIDFNICHGGRAQHRILACMRQIHFNQMLQTQHFVSAVMSEITCMITVLHRSVFFFNILEPEQYNENLK